MAARRHKFIRWKWKFQFHEFSKSKRAAAILYATGPINTMLEPTASAPWLIFESSGNSNFLFRRGIFWFPFALNESKIPHVAHFGPRFQFAHRVVELSRGLVARRRKKLLDSAAAAHRCQRAL